MTVVNDGNWAAVRSVNTLVAFYNPKLKLLVWPSPETPSGNGFPIFDLKAGRILRGPT